jgi:Domain of unknown function (DUF4386)
MTRTTNARLAGFTFLFYIAIAFPSMVLLDRATNAEGIAAKLARVAEHASDVRLAVVLSLISCFAALVLAVTLYAITREVDPDLALLALACRVGEGVINAPSIAAAAGLLWLATGAATSATDGASTHTLGAFLLKFQDWIVTISATFFAVGSTLFAWLLLRGRMIPVALAWLGVLASILVVVALPAQLAGVLPGAMAQLMWLPMLAFELPLGFWLLIKGVPMPSRTPSA